jgi:hypothetical protein
VDSHTGLADRSNCLSVLSEIQAWKWRLGHCRWNGWSFLSRGQFGSISDLTNRRTTAGSSTTPSPGSGSRPNDSLGGDESLIWSSAATRSYFTLKLPRATAVINAASLKATKIRRDRAIPTKRSLDGAPSLSAKDSEWKSRFFVHHPRTEIRSGPRSLRMTHRFLLRGRAGNDAAF